MHLSSSRHRGLRSRLIIAAVGATVALCSTGALADPALWRVKGSHASIYLYGTVHVLKPGQHWSTPTVDKALSDSADLWLEIPDADDPAKVGPLVQSLGLDPAHPLSSKLDEAELAKLDTAAKAAGLPGERAMEPMRPWLASVSLSVLPLIKAGYDPNSGVEKKLKATMSAQGKPVHGLETLEQQFHYFADMTPSTELAMLTATLDEVDAGTQRLDALVSAWQDGNLKQLGTLTNDYMARQSTDLYRILISGRNQRWASQLDTRLKGEGTSFVAVGAAHLVGPDSVQAQLTRLGYTVERVQ